MNQSTDLSQPETITLYREAGLWLARSDSYRAIFGTDSVPTPYRDTAGAAWVLSTIRELNPGVTVTVEYPTCPEGHALTTGADCSKCRWDRDRREYAADPRNRAYERRYWQRAAREHRERGDAAAAQQCERNAEQWAS